MSKIENAVLFCENVAKDDSHGYDQIDRWGNPNYDCSGLVITALEKSGILAKTGGATYTGNMKRVLLNLGFTDVKNQVNVYNGNGMLRGDVLLNEVNHTAMYCGNGKLVQASINEKGGIIGGKSGDQTGGEIAICNYYNYPWDCVLRFKENVVKVDNKIDYAEKFDKSLSGTYEVIADALNLRSGANINKKVITTMPYKSKVTCYGYYTMCNGVKWLYVAFHNFTGFCSSEWLAKR